jgi:hypothetical protein
VPDFQIFQGVQQRFIENHPLNDAADSGRRSNGMNLTAVDKINFAGLGGEAMLIDLELHRSLYNFDQLKMFMPMGRDKNRAVPLYAHFEWKTLSFKRLDFFVCRRKNGKTSSRL